VDDRIRISDADRDRATAQLRDHFAEGRLTTDELDERVTAALNAKTFGELRRVMADLPGPALTPPRAQPPPRAAPGPRAGVAAPPWALRRRPRILPLVALALLAALLIPGHGWLLFAVIKVVLLFWLVVFLAGFFVASRIRRRMRRDWWAGHPFHHYQDWPRDREQRSRWSRS
jgi:uncharacterized membrane protein